MVVFAMNKSLWEMFLLFKCTPFKHVLTLRNAKSSAA